MTPESATKEERIKRVKKLVVELKRLFPNAHIALNYSNNWELLVAVVLSAQCTDKRVNIVTKDLFKKYKTLDDYVHADVGEFEQDIRSTGFYRNKAKNILAAAEVVQEQFGGVIPRTMREMLTIPGVARKSANVILGNAYGVVEGIAVDTHVKRFAIRFNLTDHRDPIKIERDLMEIVSRKDWFVFTYLVIEYGRHIAPARKYDTDKDPLLKIYPKAKEIFSVNT